MNGYRKNNGAEQQQRFISETVTTRRICAGIVDTFVSLLVAVEIAKAVGFLSASAFPWSPSFPYHAVYRVEGILVGTVLVYWGVFEMAWRRTPGKAIFHLRVAASDGEPASAAQIALRTVMRLIDWLPNWYLLGFIALRGSGSRQQRLGDLVAHTRVVATTAARRRA